VGVFSIQPSFAHNFGGRGVATNMPNSIARKAANSAQRAQAKRDYSGCAALAVRRPLS
jgi:hypothetical protein